MRRHLLLPLPSLCRCVVLPPCPLLLPACRSRPRRERGRGFMGRGPHVSGACLAHDALLPMLRVAHTMRMHGRRRPRHALHPPSPGPPPAVEIAAPTRRVSIDHTAAGPAGPPAAAGGGGSTVSLRVRRRRRSRPGRRGEAGLRRGCSASAKMRRRGAPSVRQTARGPPGHTGPASVAIKMQCSQSGPAPAPAVPWSASGSLSCVGARFRGAARRAPPTACAPVGPVESMRESRRRLGRGYCTAGGPVETGPVEMEALSDGRGALTHLVGRTCA